VFLLVLIVYLFFQSHAGKTIIKCLDLDDKAEEVKDKLSGVAQQWYGRAKHRLTTGPTFLRLKTETVEDIESVVSNFVPQPTTDDRLRSIEAMLEKLVKANLKA
jgi:hypothetical protein